MDKSMKSLITLLAFCLTGSIWASSGFNFFHELEHTFHVPAHSISLFVATIVFLVLGIAYRSKLSNVQNTVIPDSGISLRNIIEFLGQMIMNSARSVMGEESAKRYYSYIIFVFTFILITNVMGLIPGSSTPNENLNTTLALGLFTFIYFNIQGIRAVGFINYMKHFMGPLLPLAPLIFCIEIISICIRPVSLAFRLRGNMSGDHLVLGIFSDLVPYIVPIPFYAMGLFVSFLQAFVFTILAMIYISMATAHHDHGDHGHH
jgi:F-type H+-transporting ATPase subunit a